MAQEIHARNTEGGVRFRIWSTAWDAYITAEMKEDGLRDYLLQDTLRCALDDFRRITPARLDRAKRNGTSSLVDDPRNLEGPWDEERPDFAEHLRRNAREESQ